MSLNFPLATVMCSASRLAWRASAKYPIAEMPSLYQLLTHWLQQFSQTNASALLSADDHMNLVHKDDQPFTFIALLFDFA